MGGAGCQGPAEALLWGFSIRGWGRAGKILAFLGGTTVILDLLGAHRLREWGNRIRGGGSTTLSRTFDWLAILAMVLGSLWVVFLRDDLDESIYVKGAWSWTAATVLLLTANSGFLLDFLIYLAVVTLDEDAKLVRMAAIALLVAGFQFDLLSS